MIHILIGIVVGVAFYMLTEFSKKRNVKVVWRQWVITATVFLYAVFVMAMTPFHHTMVN